MIKHSIILGCGRSGTSIFGELFEDIPGFDYYSEPDFEALLTFDYQKPIAVKVPQESENYPPDTGLSFPLKKMLAVIPNPKQFFWIVRNPLDTICSLKVGIAKNWGHHPQPPDWQDWLSEPLVKQCAYHWNYLNSVGFRQVQSLVKIKHFEALLLEPAVFAKQICLDIGLDPELAKDALNYWSGRVQNSNNKHFIEAKTSRAYSTQDHKVRIGRWKENMTKEEYEMVVPIIRDTALNFGYQVEGLL